MFVRIYTQNINTNAMNIAVLLLSTMSYLSQHDIQIVGVSVGNSLRICIEMCKHVYDWCISSVSHFNRT